MNKVFTFLFVLLISGVSAQNWELMAEDVDYQIEESELVCTSSNGVDYAYRILKFSNLSNKEIEISLELQKWYNDQAFIDPDTGSERVITIPAQSSIEGSCNSKEDYLIVYDRAITASASAPKSKLTKLEVGKIIVTKN